MMGQESERFIVPEGTFEVFEKAFMDSLGEREYEPGVYRGEPKRIRANLYGGGIVRIVRNEPHLGVFIREQVGDSGLGVVYNFVLQRNNEVVAPLVLGCGPFPDEALFEDVKLRSMIPPEPDQAKVQQLFESAQKIITPLLDVSFFFRSTS